MHTLMLCSDVAFVGTMRSVLGQLNGTPVAVGSCDEAVEFIRTQAFDVVIVDWREIEYLGDFLLAFRRSEVNSDAVLVAIVRDLLDLRQAFAAGVHFLIHKPASAVQIERCLRAAYSATVARRRKQHREPVEILASVSTHGCPFAEATIVNLSEKGLGLRTSGDEFVEGVSLTAGDEVELRFELPGTDSKLHVSGAVAWAAENHCGVRFTYVAESEQAALQQWMTACIERWLADFSEKMRMQCA